MQPFQVAADPQGLLYEVVPNTDVCVCEEYFTENFWLDCLLEGAQPKSSDTFPCTFRETNLAMKLSWINRFSLGPIEEGSKRGCDGSRGDRGSS